ncbi:hypothetical protein MUP77_14165, partial [Candidatus Bathyarchaeota archaeon]|nr:hypothetical protein [Candidatus Bathyarchaeota archaeon]
MSPARPNEKRLRTYMSQVFFKAATAEDPIPLKTQRGTDSEETDIYLLDDLLCGGIVIPDDVVEATLGIDDQDPTYANPGLLMLVTGAPGSGKSTFALELCYRLSLSCNDNSALHKCFNKGISSLYISAEASSRSLIQNAVSYGWKEDAFHILPPNPIEIKQPNNQVFVFGRDMTEGRDESADNVFAFIKEKWTTYFPDIHIDKPMPKEGLSYCRPQALVIDSLNTLGQAAPTKMREMLYLCSTRFMLTIAVLDTGPGICPDHLWAPSEYLADIEIDFSYDRPENYLIRKMWVVKARFQDHADGFHRMKINPKPSAKAIPNPLNPLIKEGGIFVFPSIHRHLSVARGAIDKFQKRKFERYTEAIETPFTAMNNAIRGGGFPSGACSLIVGDRGGMKSHLAYYTLLRFLMKNPNERATIISLRDTQDAAESTLAEILLQQVDDNEMKLNPAIKNRDDAEEFIREKLVADDRLEILYFWPGYISSEEFFHLVCTSVDRPGISKKKKQRPPASLVVLNGIEQLSARFPLCDKESMFVSGLLSMLTVKGITVLGTSGGLANIPSHQGGVPQGLLPMSDLIIETS